MFKYISDNPPAFNNGVDFNISAVVQSLVASVANVVVSVGVKERPEFGSSVDDELWWPQSQAWW